MEVMVDITLEAVCKRLKEKQANKKIESIEEKWWMLHIWNVTDSSIFWEKRRSLF